MLRVRGSKARVSRPDTHRLDARVRRGGSAAASSAAGAKVQDDSADTAADRGVPNTFWAAAPQWWSITKLWLFGAIRQGSTQACVARRTQLSPQVEAGLALATKVLEHDLPWTTSVV